MAQGASSGAERAGGRGARGERAAAGRRGGWVWPTLGSLAVIAATGGVLFVLAVVKKRQFDALAAQSYAEPVESVEAARAEAWEFQPTLTAIGTVQAQRWITLQNEMAGVVERVNLVPGAVVERGELLVQQDVSVEQAELRRAEANAKLAQLTLARVQSAVERSAASEPELERADAERDAAQAAVDEIRAMIDRKTIVAPFRARVGLSDVHEGQYLGEGVELTTLQGVSDAVYVDVPVPQEAAVRLPPVVEIVPPRGEAVQGRVMARDALTNRETRNTMLRVEVNLPETSAQPGMSVRVRVPTGEMVPVATLPATAIRRGPLGDFVWLLSPDAKGQLRAREQRVQVGGAVPGGTKMFLLGGVKPGDLVASSGSFKLREGSAVLVSEGAGTAAVAARSGT